MNARRGRSIERHIQKWASSIQKQASSIQKQASFVQK